MQDPRDISMVKKVWLNYSINVFFLVTCSWYFRILFSSLFMESYGGILMTSRGERTMKSWLGFVQSSRNGRNF